MRREEKVAFVESVKSFVMDSDGLVIFRQEGLDAASTFELRSQARAMGLSFKIAKNTLMKIALEGTPYGCLSSHFEGPLGFAYGDSFLQLAKWAKKADEDFEGFQMVSGVMNGQLFEKDALSKIAELPSVDVIRGRLVGLVQAPASQLVAVTRAVSEQVARVFGVYGASA